MKLRWGILGLGNIAHQFTQDLLLSQGSTLQAVASRSSSTAQDFAAKYGATTAYGNYESLMADQEVDIIYIATPHDSHAAYSIECMKHHKHVLCEKPIAVNKAQLKQMIEVAKENNVFLMEAFWSRFNPSIVDVLEKINQGAIGEVNYVNADFTFYLEDSVDSRMLNMNLAGGSLLDMGVYPVFLAYSVLGFPEQILATSRNHATGADLQTAAILKNKKGVATIMSGFKSESDMVAKIYGTRGHIYIDRIWHEAQAYTICIDGVSTEIQHPTLGKGFTYEIAECERCIEAGKSQSDQWSWKDSLAVLEITDEIRKQTGVIYPFEQ